MNQPTQQFGEQPMHQPMPQHAGAPMQYPPHKSSAWIPWTILAVIVVAALVVIGFVFRSKLFPTQASAAVKLSGYQAVFLSNGQVYFGKISHINDNYVELTDIYYLQVNQPLQTGAAGSGSAASTAAAANSSAAASAQQLSLVKLGNELHGPADQMEINREQILFYENMKADGQVAKAIAQYQQSGGSTGATNSTPAQGTQQAPNAPTSTSVSPTSGTQAPTGSTATH